jgi:hypothetical protein
MMGWRGSNQGSGSNNFNFDPSRIKTITTPDQWSKGQTPDQWSKGMAPILLSLGSTKTTYDDGQGGSWTKGSNGEWQGANGQKVNDLAGYLNMRGQQQSGADFSGYQRQLDQQLKQQQQANQQYQRLLQDPNSVQQTAGYQFAVNQGNEAINRSAAAKGSLNSGNVLAELAKYGQGMGAQQYQQQLSNLQQNYQNQNTQTNNLANLMQGAQQFGINSGYYQNPQNQGWSDGGPYGSKQKTIASTW